METLAVVTTEVHPDLVAVYARQPAATAPSDFGARLRPDAHADDLLTIARTPHTGPCKVIAVSGLVNDVRNDRPSVLAPVG